MTDALAVLIATRGRPAVLAELLAALAAQTRPPDAVIVVGTTPDDWAGTAPRPGLWLLAGPPGLPAQRNVALREAADRFGTLVFFDDDFVPSRFWLERAASLFGARRDLAALTGLVLADGIRGPGIPADQARALVRARDEAPPASPMLHEGIGPYGCNMAFRAERIANLRFDARLPLYGWLEDSDFGAQAARRGATARAEALWGVHLGHKTGRVPGVRLGYSQIVNPVYLTAKGTLPGAFSARLMAGNVLANMARALRPEPFVDRAGRLRGNLIGLGDVLRGRVTPERAASL